MQSYGEKLRENFKVFMLWTFLIYHEKIHVKYAGVKYRWISIHLDKYKKRHKVRQCSFISCKQRNTWLFVYLKKKNSVSLFLQVNPFSYETSKLELEAIQPKQINTLENKVHYGNIGSICQINFFFAIRYKEVQLLP